MRHTLGFAVAVLIALPHFSDAQSIGELAAREREKKKGQKAGKVITEDDLRRAGQGGRGNVSADTPASAASPAPGASAAPAAGAADAAKPKTDDELRAEQEQAWRLKLKKAQEDVQKLTQVVEALQQSLNDLSGNVYGSQRTNLLNQSEKASAELKAAQQQVAGLEEEGRRSRFRP